MRLQQIFEEKDICYITFVTVLANICWDLR